MVFNLFIACNKLQAFHFLGLLSTPLARTYIFWSMTLAGPSAGLAHNVEYVEGSWGRVSNQPWRLDVLCRDVTEARTVYQSHLDEESLCLSGQRGSFKVSLQPWGILNM